MEDATFSGPIFDGKAVEEIRRGTDAVRHEVAKRGAELAGAAFLSAIRENHGKFMHSITITSESRSYSSGSGRHEYIMAVEVPMDCEVVTTDLATYGPWLEGTGSRNETTRFKGYHGFRNAAQELDRQAEVIADRTLEPYVMRVNA